MEILQAVWKQHLRPRAVVGYGVNIFTSPDHLEVWTRVTVHFVIDGHE